MHRRSDGQTIACLMDFFDGQAAPCGIVPEDELLQVHERALVLPVLAHLHPRGSPWREAVNPSIRQQQVAGEGAACLCVDLTEVLGTAEAAASAA